jgi:hypothetical protein
MKKLKSSNIDHIKYDEKTKTLHVKFHNSEHTYQYPDVLDHEYKAFESAKSHGEHFSKYIKHRPFKKIDHGRKKAKK